MVVCGIGYAILHLCGCHQSMFVEFENGEKSVDMYIRRYGEMEEGSAAAGYVIGLVALFKFD